MDEDNFVDIGFSNYFQKFTLEDENNSWGMCLIFKKLYKINLKLRADWSSENMNEANLSSEIRNKAILDIENEIIPSTYF